MRDAALTHNRSESPVLPSVLFWAVVLLAVGGVQRWLNAVYNAPSPPIVLDQPLSTFPTELGDWKGVDVPVDARVLQVAGSDDYVNRRYVEQGTGNAIDFHLAYTARPANMLGHRPEACYPANGWTLTGTKTVRVTAPNGKPLECLIHSFTLDKPESEGLVVLNYYILQGRHTTQWTDFWGPKWRGRNLARDPNFYVAQVQVVSTVMLPSLYERTEAIVRRFAAETALEVDALLPLTDRAATEGERPSPTLVRSAP